MRHVVTRSPVIVSFIGAVSWFWLTGKLRRFKVSEKPPASRAHLSQEERQRKVVIGSWITFVVACLFLFGGFMLLWLENSN